MNTKELILDVLKLSIVINVFALGLTAKWTDATYLFRRPKQLVRAFLSMNVVMPALAIILALNFSLDPAVKIALVALSVSPVPPFFPKTALKQGCEENYTVGLLVAMGLMAVGVIPATMHILQLVFEMPLRQPVGEIAYLVLRTIVVPLMVGIAIRAFAPTFAERAVRRVGMFATILLILSVLPILVFSMRPMLSLIGNGTILALSAFAAGGLLVGYLLGGPGEEERYVLSLATAARHPGIAVAIAQTNFPDQKLALPAIALYLIVAAILSRLAKRRAATRISETEVSKAA